MNEQNGGAMMSECEHKWEATTLGTGTEKCLLCELLRPRTAAEKEEDETRMRYAELGFRNGAMRTAEGLDEMARHADEQANEWRLKADAYRAAASSARLIARGRAPDG